MKYFAIRQQCRRMLLFHCKTQILYIVDSKISQKYKRNTLLRFYGNTVSKNERQYYIVHTLAILLKYYDAKGPLVNLSIRTLSQTFVYVQFTQIFNCKSNCLFIHYVCTALHGRDKKKDTWQKKKLSVPKRINNSSDPICTFRVQLRWFVRLTMRKLANQNKGMWTHWFITNFY